MFFDMLVNVRKAKKRGLAWGKQYLLGRKLKFGRDSPWTGAMLRIEAFPAGNRTSQPVKVYLSQIFARFGIPRTLVSDNGPEFVSSDLKKWCESLGIKKMESPIYHPRANGIAERAVQTVKRAIQAWSANLNVSFGAFLQRALMTHRNTSKTRGKTPVEQLLGRKIRLPAVTDFDLCERVLFKPTNSSPPIPATFIIRKGMNTSFIQPENSNKRVLVSDNQIALLESDDIKTESTDSQSESSRDDIDVASPNSTEETSVVEGEQPSVATRTSSRIKNNQKDLEKLLLQSCLKKEGGCDISSELINLS